jgi:hypothetical protein
MPINASMRPQLPDASVTDPRFGRIASVAEVGSWPLSNVTELRLAQNRFGCR